MARLTENRFYDLSEGVFRPLVNLPDTRPRPTKAITLKHTFYDPTKYESSCDVRWSRDEIIYHAIFARIVPDTNELPQLSVWTRAYAHLSGDRIVSRNHPDWRYIRLAGEFIGSLHFPIHTKFSQSLVEEAVAAVSQYNSDNLDLTKLINQHQSSNNV